MFHKGIVDGSYFQFISLLNLVLDIDYLILQLHFISALLRYSLESSSNHIVLSAKSCRIFMLPVK